jgi:CelD/BcsL family acetyltransferase involved in cellulose biosynthesis
LKARQATVLSVFEIKTKPALRGEIRTHVVRSFEDPRCNAELWARLLCQGDSDEVCLTWHWLRSWWETLGKGELLLIAAERRGEVVALAPFYYLEGMVFFLGAGESDYLDFIGDLSDPEVLPALLGTAREAVSEFIGFRLHFVLQRSRTGQRLQEAAARVGLDCLAEDELPAVEIDLIGEREAIDRALQRSMLKREEFFRQRGPLEIQQLQESEAIRRHLPAFFAQHLARWQAKDLPSPFTDARHRAFLERFLEVAAETGWIRFLCITWQGHPLAFEFAWYYKGEHFSAPWCFAIEHARHSPGHVLLRQSLLAAQAAGLQRYDLGGGDQTYKFRFPANVKRCTTWGLYPG